MEDLKHVVAIDPTLAWREGWGQVLRTRTIAFVSAVGVAASAAGGHWLSLWSAFSIAIGFSGIVIGLVVGRVMLLRAANVSIRFHEFSHMLRDEVAGVIQAAQLGDNSLYGERFQRFHDDVANRIARLYSAWLGDEANCAIRLAYFDKTGQSYKTVGRSQGMEASRRELSESIPADKGIAWKLRTVGQGGVLVIRDISEAIRRGWWLETRTDRLPDVKTLMIAPINGFIGSTKVMLGIVYVSSRKDVFRLIHLEPMKGFADLLGLVYPMIIGTFEFDDREVNNDG